LGSAAEAVAAAVLLIAAPLATVSFTWTGIVAVADVPEASATKLKVGSWPFTVTPPPGGALAPCIVRLESMGSVTCPRSGSAAAYLSCIVRLESMGSVTVTFWASLDPLFVTLIV
jgi:hypothetical protein